MMQKYRKAIQHHAQDTLAEKYAASLVDLHKNLIIDDMPTVLEYLSYNFG